MPLPLARRFSLALPILFYLLALVSLWLHLSTDDRPMLVVAVLAGLAGIGIAAGLVLHQRAVVGRLGRVSSGS